MNNIQSLSLDELAVLSKKFQQFPEIEKVILFGSRAIGNFKTYSDVDLAVVGDVGLEVIVRLKYTLEEETNLPYFFDVVDYASIEKQELKKHIDEFGITIFQKKTSI